jgi:hypothetical protein
MGTAHTPADDIFYDLVSIQYHALQGAHTYDRYLKDAADHADVRQFIEQVRDQDAERASRVHELLKQLTEQSGGAMG